jgi:hypothetical protein
MKVHNENLWQSVKLDRMNFERKKKARNLERGAQIVGSVRNIVSKVSIHNLRVSPGYEPKVGSD